MPGYLFVCIPKPVHQHSKAIRFFEWSQVLALEVFDQGNLGDCPVVDVHLDTRHLLQSRLEARPVPALTADDHESAADLTRPHQQRFQNSLLFYRGRELFKFSKVDSRLLRVWLELVNRYHPANRCSQTPACENLDVVRVMAQL